MRPPASIKNWLGQKEMFQWLQDASGKTTYQRRLAIWMTSAGKIHAHKIADMLGVSTQSVWAWIKQYNNYGPIGLETQARGGRKWSYLNSQQERQILFEALGFTQNDTLPSVRQVKEILEKKIGKKVSLSYVYKLLRRHNWPHIFRDLNRLSAKEDNFNKYSSPWKRSRSHYDY